MATIGNERYLRSILLLNEGGSFITKCVMESEVEKSGEQLDTILIRFQHKLKHELHPKQVDKLFPASGKTDINEWDLQMLTNVILTIFCGSLDRSVKQSIRTIRRLRNDVLAHNSNPSLEETNYIEIIEELTDSVLQLSEPFDSQVQQICHDLIDKCTRDPLDVKSSIEHMKALNQKDDHFTRVLQAIEFTNDRIKEVGTSLERNLAGTQAQLSNQMSVAEKNLSGQLEGITKALDDFMKSKTTAQVTVACNTEIFLGEPNDERTREIQMTFVKTINEAFANAKSPDELKEIRQTTDEFLAKIKSLKDVRFKGATMKCILLMFECTSWEGVQQLLDFVHSKVYQDELNNIAHFLQSHFHLKSTIQVTSRIPENCLESIREEIESVYKEISNSRKANDNQQYTEEMDTPVQDQSVERIQLMFDCYSVDGVKQLWHLFEKGGAAHELKNMEEALNGRYGRDVKLSTSVDLERLSRTIELNKSGGTVQHGEMAVLTDEEVEKNIVTLSGDTVNIGVMDVLGDEEVEKDIVTSRARQAKRIVVTISDTQLRNLPETLLNLKQQLSEDSVISSTINSLICNSKELLQNYISAFKKEGNNVLRKKRDLVRISRSSEVVVKDFQTALYDFRLRLSKALEEMKLLEHKVHSSIADCSKRQKEHENSVKAEEYNVQRINREIQSLEDQRNQKLEKAKKYDIEADRYREKAEEQANKKERTAERGLVGGLFGVGVGLVLAPLSGGASLLASASALGWTVGHTAAVLELKETAEKFYKYARNEREGAEEARKNASSLENSKTTCERNIAHSNRNIQTLKTTQSKLDKIESCLRTTIQLMNKIETHVQDLDSSMRGATLHGEIFEILQQALSDCPQDEDVADETHNLMMELREKWKLVEEEIMKTTSRV